MSVFIIDNWSRIGTVAAENRNIHFYKIQFESKKHQTIITINLKKCLMRKCSWKAPMESAHRKCNRHSSAQFGNRCSTPLRRYQRKNIQIKHKTIIVCRGNW